jgi:HD-like signal output (HDOD) protein
MYRWLRRLFASPAAAPLPPPAVVPAAEAATPPVPPEPPPARPGPSLPPPVSFEQLERVNGAWNGWLFDRCGEGGLDVNDAEERVLDALAAILASQQSGAALVRRMPGLVPQLLQSLRSDSFSGSALSRTISSDPVLVAAIVRLANNCQSGSGKRIASVEQAVILIGQEGLRQLITTVAFRPIIDINSGFYTRRLAPKLWEHAERCAMSARRIAADGAAAEPFDAFLAGLLQNVGLIAALRIMDGAVRGDTRLLAASIAREWNFPESVAVALLEQGELRKGAPMSALGRVLKLTDYLGKVRMLVENGLLDESETALFSGLPAQAVQCYSTLAASKELT